jgi:gliding motility-associated-like protein
MKYFLLSLFTLILSGSVYGQITIIDTPHCLDHTLHAEITGGIIPTSSGITADDAWSGVIPIGFTFNFYGLPNTSCIVGSNGCLGFNLANAFAYNTWPISTTLAATASADMRNVICGPWCDVYIAAGGTIQYSTQGTAPNRNFAITWCGTHMFGCTAEWLTTQIIIYESTGIAEVHLGHRTICATGWNGSRAVIGVKNPAGTIATTPPLRDYAPTWTATNEAWRFSPIAGPSYSVSLIPYAPIPYAASGIFWYDSSTGAYLGSGPDLTVIPLVPTTYIACALGCNDTTKAYLHIVPATLGSGGLPFISGVTSVDPTVCGKCNGSITIHGVSPHTVDSVIYSYNGVQQPVIVDSAGADSLITISGLCSGVYDYIYYKIQNCPSNQMGPLTLGYPPITLALDYTIHLGCNHDVIDFRNLSTPMSSEYVTAWSFGDGNTSAITDASHIYANNNKDSTYTVKLTYSTLYGCAKDTTMIIPLVHPIDAHFTVNANSVCIGTELQFDANTINRNLPSYVWNFGDGRPTVELPANGVNHDTIVTNYTYPIAGFFTATLTVTDTIGCQAIATDTFDVISLDIHTSVHDTSVCLVDSMTLWALPLDPKQVITPSYIPFIYSWTPANNIGQTNASTTKFMGIGTYVYTILVSSPPLILNPAGCNASDTEKIISYPPVAIGNLTAGPVTIAYGSSIQLNAEGGNLYTWTPDNGTLNNPNINNPIATPTDPSTIYTVYVRNTFGCIDSAFIIVNVDRTMPDILPSGFSPNNDGLNDVFRLHDFKYQKLVQFSVYNRWGIEIFHTSDPSIGWDGTYQGIPQDIGVYNYQVIVGHPDGVNKAFKGTVTLIR